MSVPAAPIKTPLGIEELRNRTRGLGQRFRTILLLVDGRRPLGEVLATAHGAGALTSHFEELVRLGLVELPSDAMAPEPAEPSPDTLDDVRVTSVELEVPVDGAEGEPERLSGFELESLIGEPDLLDEWPPEAPDSSVAELEFLGEPAPDEAPLAPTFEAFSASPHAEALFRHLAEVVSPAKPPISQPDSDRIAQARARRSRRLAGAESEMGELAESSGSTATAGLPADAVRHGMSASTAAAPASASASALERAAAPHPTSESLTTPVRLSDLAPVTSAAPRKLRATVPAARTLPLLQARVRESAFAEADHVRPAPEQSEEQLLSQVQEILTGVLRLDGPLFGSFTATRVRAAQSQQALISLVWEIERQRSHVRRSRPQLFALQRARELLGMGNTLVALDSQPGLDDDS